MFDLKRPCKTCPFLTEQGPNFRLPEDRIDEICTAPWFACHSTLEDGPDEDEDGNTLSITSKSQHCAGLASMLLKDGAANQMMRICMRVGEMDPERYEAMEGTYDTIEDAIEGHTTGC